MSRPLVDPGLIGYLPTAMSARLISIVIPVWDEAESLEHLAREIRMVADRHGLNIQAVFVDDGSRDASWAGICRLAGQNPWIGGLRFRRNEGKAAALMAGFGAAQGDVIVTMDADLQDPPDEIPNLLARLNEGFDMVSGWKRVRHDPWHKVYPSRVFNWMIGAITGVHLHDHVCGLKCFRREAAKALRLYGEFHRFMGVLASAKGFKVTEIPTLHRPRMAGVGKYGFSRFAKGFTDMLVVTLLTRYRRRPQHAFGVAALLTLAVSLIGLIPGTERLGVFLGLVVLGFLLMGLGLLAGLIADQAADGNLYSIVERTGWCANEGRDERQLADA